VGNQTQEKHHFWLAGFRSFSAQARSALRWSSVPLGSCHTSNDAFKQFLAGAVLTLSVSQVYASEKINYDDVRKTIGPAWIIFFVLIRVV